MKKQVPLGSSLWSYKTTSFCNAIPNASKALRHPKMRNQVLWAV